MLTIDHLRAGLCSHAELTADLQRLERTNAISRMATDSPAGLARCDAQLADIRRMQAEANRLYRSGEAA